MELVKKEVLLLGRYFHLKDACFNHGSNGTEKKKVKAKRKGSKEVWKERGEDMNFLSFNLGLDYSSED